MVLTYLHQLDPGDLPLLTIINHIITISINHILTVYYQPMVGFPISDKHVLYNSGAWGNRAGQSGDFSGILGYPILLERRQPSQD